MTGYHGYILLVDQDGLEWTLGVSAGRVCLSEDSPFLVLPRPIDGNVWEQVPLVDCEFPWPAEAPIASGGLIEFVPAIPPLEWRGYGERLTASAFGIEVFYQVSGLPGEWTLKSPGAREYVDTPGYETQHAAKAAAQLDFERRVRASLRKTEAPE